MVRKKKKKNSGFFGELTVLFFIIYIIDYYNKLTSPVMVHPFSNMNNLSSPFRPLPVSFQFSASRASSPGLEIVLESPVKSVFFCFGSSNQTLTG